MASSSFNTFYATNETYRFEIVVLTYVSLANTTITEPARYWYRQCASVTYSGKPVLSM